MDFMESKEVKRITQEELNLLDADFTKADTMTLRKVRELCHIPDVMDTFRDKMVKRLETVN